jgi:ABC-type glutathione transport system ATPase component
MLSTGIKSITIRHGNSENLLLEDINFQLDENKISVILGKNGTGKSTLIKALTRLLDERFYKITGNILIDDKDLMQMSVKELTGVRMNKIRYVFQDAINSFDPLKKVGYYFRKYQRNENLIILLEELLLPEKEKLFGLYPYEISGGMAQRLLLVLALLKNPDVLILDEPTSGIDAPISNLILLKLREFVSIGKNSVLLVTQDLQFAKSSGDRISFLSDRKLSPFFNSYEFFEERKITASDNFISAYTALL